MIVKKNFLIISVTAFIIPAHAMNVNWPATPQEREERERFIRGQDAVDLWRRLNYSCLNTLRGIRRTEEEFEQFIQYRRQVDLQNYDATMIERKQQAQRDAEHKHLEEIHDKGLCGGNCIICKESAARWAQDLQEKRKKEEEEDKSWG